MAKDLRSKTATPNLSLPPLLNVFIQQKAITSLPISFAGLQDQMSPTNPFSLINVTVKIKIKPLSSPHEFL